MSQYNELTPELVEALRGIVGEDNCYTGEDINEDYSHDEMPIYGSVMPAAVVLPTSTEQVSAVMELCNRNLMEELTPLAQEEVWKRRLEKIWGMDGKEHE